MKNDWLNDMKRRRMVSYDAQDEFYDEDPYLEEEGEDYEDTHGYYDEEGE